MGENTKIEWAHHTFNPWWGCVKVSPACDHCYAESFAKRTGNAVWGKDAPRRFFGEKHWTEPYKWNREAEASGERKRVFCASMADVMEDREDVAPHREMLFLLIEQTPWLDWLLLTKRPQNFIRFLPALWLCKPQPNVWLMTTLESAEYTWRVEALLNTPAAIRGLSMEPLLGPVYLQSLAALDWVIVGGESGPGARPMHPEWARGLRDQCQVARVPFFFKQWGEWSTTRNENSAYGEFHGPSAWIDSCLCKEGTATLYRNGKKLSGRELDGREWNEAPGNE